MHMVCTFQGKIQRNLRKSSMVGTFLHIFLGCRSEARKSYYGRIKKLCRNSK